MELYRILYGILYIYNTRIVLLMNLLRQHPHFLKKSQFIKIWFRVSQWVGFEPTREDPIWFLVRRLNHSAITATNTAFQLQYSSLLQK